MYEDVISVCTKKGNYYGSTNRDELLTVHNLRVVDTVVTVSDQPYHSVVIKYSVCPNVFVIIRTLL